MSFHPLLLLGASAAIALCPATLSAEFVYDAGVQASADLPAAMSDVYSYAPGNQVMADDFQLGSAATVNRVDWLGKSFFGGENFSIEFYGFGGRSVSVAPITRYTIGQDFTRSSTGFHDQNGQPIYSYSAAIPESTFEAGDYLISIASNTTAGEPPWFWVYSATGGDGFLGGQVNSPDNWAPALGLPYARTSFALRNVSDAPGVTAVPEPTSLATLAVCLTFGGAGASRLWQRRTTAHQKQQST